MIEIKDLIELIMVTLVMKLIVIQWTPPIQRSLQAIICLIIGSGFGIFLNPSKEGVITAIIGAGFAFYGGELLDAFKHVADDALEFEEEIKEIKDLTKK